MIENGHLAGRVVDGVVGALGERHAAGRHDDRPLRHIVGTEGDDVGLRATILTLEDILVFLSDLLGDGLCGVVELGESVFLRYVGCHTVLHEVVVHVASERLRHGEEHAAVAHRVAFDIVEIAVAVGFVVVVEAVGTEELDDRCALDLLLGDIAEVDTGGVALVFHVEAELLLLDIGGEIVDVLHHQRPVALRGVVAGVFQRLHEERLFRVGDVAGELTHLIGAASVGVLISHGKHLIGLQRGLERDVAECVVHCVLGRGQEACALQFLIVGAAFQPRAVEDSGSLVDVARRTVAVRHRLILRVGGIRRHGGACRGPTAVAHLRVLTEVREGDDVSGVCRRSALVGHPDFHTVDGHARGEVRQRSHAGIVVVVEIL